MLYNVLLIILVLYVCVTPYFYAKAVKFGISLAKDEEGAMKTPIFGLPSRKKKPEMTPAEKRRAEILANIDRYDGTPNGQKEITVGKING